MPRMKGMIRPGGFGKKKKAKGQKIKKRPPMAFRKAEGTGEPLRAARMLAGY